MKNLMERRDQTVVNDRTVKRHLFQGVINIIRFNWHYYLIALIGSMTGILILTLFSLPDWVRWFCLLSIVVTGYLLFASLVASLWIYDLSSLYRWQWLGDFLDTQPVYALNIHSGFDETSVTLQQLFPGTVWQVADFFHPAKQTEASIVRARQAYPPPIWCKQVSPSYIPYSTGSFDTIFLLFAAHEIRNIQERNLFFQELKRLLQPGGTIVLVEHLREIANFTVFGPGALHFYPEHEWERLAHQAGLSIKTSVHYTPFVTAFKLSL